MFSALTLLASVPEICILMVNVLGCNEVARVEMLLVLLTCRLSEDNSRALSSVCVYVFFHVFSVLGVERSS